MFIFALMNYRWLIVLCCCAACLQARAQVCQTKGNLIRSVSVNAAGELVINWDEPADLPGNATGYIIYDYVGGAQCTNIIAIVGLSDHSYTHAAAKPLTGSRAYSLAVDTGSGDSGDITQQHAFSWLTAEYDSCRYLINMQWSAYVGWEQVTYNVYGGERGTSPTLLAEKITGLQYMHAGTIPDNVFYEVYVKAVNAADPAAKSVSNRVEVFTKTLQRPAYMTIQTLRYADRQVQLQFIIDPATRLSTFHVMRSKQIAGTYAPVHTFSEKTLQTYTDSDVQEVYYYRLVAENNCSLTAIQGNVMNNLELLIKADNGAWYLSWNKLFNGQSYSLERLEPSPQQLLFKTADSTYTDRIDISLAALNYCYRIESITDIGGTSTADACAGYEPEVLMPDAIDPESTVQNPQTGRRRNQFGPVLFIDAASYAYQLEIYDRNGSRIAFVEKTNADSPLEKSWTGVNAQGDFVPENMYLYRLEIVFTNGTTVRKTGNVAVIYN
jgi:hypothetical protein